MRELRFVERREADFAEAILEAVSRGACEVCLYPASAGAEAIARALVQHLASDIVVKVLTKLPIRLEAGNSKNARLSVFALFPETDDVLPELLHRFLDWEGGWLIAPKTKNLATTKPLFLVSIPKAGTHLLYELARKLGYRDGVELTNFARPAHWYCLEYSNSHTAAADFFVDSVRRAPFGNRAHPFPITPTLFIYRNPLDILVSEAGYYHRDGKTLFSGYLPQDSIEHRVERLIDDRWLLGSIRDRVGKFLPWLGFPNVIPVSYEELVGTEGGGDDAVRSRLIWSLQLKLHVGGNPETIGVGLYDKDSPTFHRGTIGRYRSTLSSRTLSSVLELGQDFLPLFGYEGSSLSSAPFPPHRAEEFRNRPLVLGKVDHSKTPLTVDVFLDCNLVSYCSRYYAVPQWLGDLDFSALTPARIAEFTSAGTLEELRGVLAFGRQEYEYSKVRAAQRKQPQLLKETYRGFNLASFEGSLWAIEQAAGHLEFNRPKEMQSWLKDGKLLNAGTVDGIRLGIDTLLERRKLQSGLSEANARAEAAGELGAETARALIAEVLDELHKELEQARRRLEAVAEELTEANARAVAEADRRTALASTRIAELADELRNEDKLSRRQLETAVNELDKRLTATRTNLEAGWIEALDVRERAIVGRLDGFVNSSRGQFQRIDLRLDELAASISAMCESINSTRTAISDGLSGLATRAERDVAESRIAMDSVTERLIATVEEHVRQLAGGIAESGQRAGRIEQTLREQTNELEKLRAESAAAIERIDKHNAAVAWNPLIRIGLFLRRIVKK
jgi:hypothetical protein